MKTLLTALLIVGAVQETPALAAKSAASPLLGSWAVDVSRLPMPPEARPKGVTITFGETGAGQWTTQVDIVGGDGSARQMRSTYSPDGTPAPIEGDMAEADTAAVKMPSPDVMVLALGKNGLGASTRIYSVAPGGKEMTETAVYFAKDGKPVMRINYFTRIR